MSQPSPAAEHTAAAVTAAFQRIHDESFRGEALENELLEVEVLYAGEIENAFGTQVVLVLITPWAMNGVVLPGRGLPESMDVVRVLRHFTAMELPDVGSYTQVTLVGDVSKYSSQAQARTIAQSLIPVLMAGLNPEPTD
jgi:hypothetical protein